MALRNSVVPAALAFAGCLPSESEPPPEFEQLTYETPMLGGDCETEDVTYHVYAQVTREGSLSKSATSVGSLLVAVAESSSVIDCGEDLVKIAVPGAELTEESFAGASERFTIEVPAVLIGGHRPSIRVSALLDANDNGACDRGELTASFEAKADGLGDVALDLSDEGCPARL